MEFKPFKLADAVGDAQNLAGNAMRLSGAVRQEQAYQSLTSALQDGSPEAMESFKQSNPVEAMQFDETKAKSNIQKLHLTSLRAEVLGRLASGVTDQATYQRAIQQAKEAGVDTTDWPANYDPNVVNQFKEQALSMKQRVDQAIKGAEFQLKRNQLDETMRHNRAMEGIASKKADKETKGGDRSNPSHMNAVTRAAANKLGLQTDNTGRLMADVPPENLNKHNALAAEAQRIYLNNPGLSPAEAVEQASKKVGGDNTKLPEGVPPPDKRPVGFKSPDGKYKWTGTGWLPN